MLREAVESYLEVRRAAGFKLQHDRSILLRFTRFASERGETHLVSETAVKWAGQAISINERDRRLRALVRFARHANVEDPNHQIPPRDLYRRCRSRRTPCIFSSDQISQLLEQARLLGPLGSLRPHTYVTLFSLLSVTGLRISEALNLRFDDHTPDGLIIRQTKFRKSRMVPLHETTVYGLREYEVHRRKLVQSDDYLFISLRGHKLCYESVRKVFHSLVEKVGISRGDNSRLPQIHSFRHTFAVRALECCRCNRDYVDKHLVALSTYLGHAHVSDTYWYLEATPELLCDIAAARDRLVKGGAK
jgi:integrase/recombinase XerD